MINQTKDDKWYKKTMDELEKNRHYCKCGHSMIIPYWVDRQLCSFCGNYVYQNKEIEFKYKLKGMIKNVNEQEKKKN